MGLFGFGKKKEKEQPMQVEEPIKMNAPVIEPVTVAEKSPAPPEVANSSCPLCHKPLGEYPVDLLDAKICHKCGLLLRGDVFIEASNGTFYDSMEIVELEAARELNDLSRSIINRDLADLKEQVDNYSFIADLYDTEEFDYGCTCAKVIVLKGDNPKGCRATILDENGKILTYALIENAIPYTGYDFKTSYATNETEPYEWNTEAYAWLILAIEPSQLEDGCYIVLE